MPIPDHNTSFLPADLSAYDLATRRKILMSLRTFKLIKAALVSLMVVAIATFAIAEGAEPTSVGILAISAIGLINGIDLAEWMAVKQEIETRQVTDGADDGEEDEDP